MAALSLWLAFQLAGTHNLSSYMHQYPYSLYILPSIHTYIDTNASPIYNARVTMMKLTYGFQWFFDPSSLDISFLHTSISRLDLYVQDIFDTRSTLVHNKSSEMLRPMLQTHVLRIESFDTFINVYSTAKQHTKQELYQFTKNSEKKKLLDGVMYVWCNFTSTTEREYFNSMRVLILCKVPTSYKRGS